MTGEPICLCQDVSRTFGAGPRAVHALRGVTAAVTEGAHVALVGPSGSGKSTLLHLMAALDTPTTGRVTWQLSGGQSRRRAQIGLVFQAPSLLEPLSVVENVELPLLLDGAEPLTARSRAEDALRELGLFDLCGQLPEELSGGQAQRVAVARVLAGRPRLILADEPTGQLDEATGALVVDALSDSARTLGAALVVATHDPAVAARMDEQWTIADGRLESSSAVTGGSR